MQDLYKLHINQTYSTKRHQQQDKGNLNCYDKTKVRITTHKKKG